MWGRSVQYLKEKVFVPSGICSAQILPVCNRYLLDPDLKHRKTAVVYLFIFNLPILCVSLCICVWGATLEMFIGAVSLVQSLRSILCSLPRALIASGCLQPSNWHFICRKVHPCFTSDFGHSLPPQEILIADAVLPHVPSSLSYSGCHLQSADERALNRTRQFPPLNISSSTHLKLASGREHDERARLKELIIFPDYLEQIMGFMLMGMDAKRR